MRKSPTQARAAQTVDAIVEAAIQILQSDGEERLTTNRIAERAGVSIGSLYQYFADKEAIVEAVAERERDRVVATILKSLSEVKSDDFESVTREVIRTMVGAFARRRRARRIVLLTMLRRWQDTPDKGADEVARFLVDAAVRTKAKVEGRAAGDAGLGLRSDARADRRDPHRGAGEFALPRDAGVRGRTRAPLPLVRKEVTQARSAGVIASEAEANRSPRAVQHARRLAKMR